MDRDKLLEKESDLRVGGSQAGWITLDATRVAEHWTFFPHSNMGLYLKVTDENGEECSTVSSHFTYFSFILFFSLSMF